MAEHRPLQRKNFEEIFPLANGALQTTGGTMTGAIILNADPTQNLQATTKQYVDSIFNYIVGSGYAGVVINVKNSGEPLQNVDLYYSPQNGVKALFGNLTDVFGNCAFAVKPGTSYTFKVASNSGASFVDVTSSSTTVPSTIQAGKIYYYSFAASFIDYYELLSGSKSILFSSATTRVDVSLVGGGESGGTGFSKYEPRSGYGGDGGKILNQTNVNFEPNKLYTLSVGTGGVNNIDSVSSQAGTPSTAFGLSSDNGVSGGNGGPGLMSSTSRPDGTAASADRYSSFSGTTPCSGGGGGGGLFYGGTTANGQGATNGGNGGNYASAGSNARGIGGGGGGGGARSQSSGESYKKGGNGGDGYIGIRIHH